MMEGYSFIRNNTGPDALIINLWDYGNARTVIYPM